ncbi:Na+/H+ antiporter subunit E [Devosia yakushimensis]|uniref:Na+/H+ antiporter subunit E n=1 Tax=Devosia yakushimensis TaxID=470028 RepID=A0ABQ5UE06_9HYPH|nr:Na+/H+ antiporter subunit E [Devosia yakushimensis]GLQ10320.1 Na+/H+ antiporter subunit E [Devosia yakushimensis]
MSPAVIVIVLALGWATITGNFSGLNLLFGAAIGALAVLLLRSAFAPPRALLKLRRIISLALLFLYELMVSAIRVAIIVLTPDLKSALRPAIVAVPLTVKSDAEITLLANLITLTPGTLSVDVSDDRSLLYVHVLTLSTREALIADIASGFETKVKEVFA